MATTPKKKAKSKAPARRKASDKKPARKTTEEILVDVVKALRENPEKYRRFREELRRSKSDDERARVLLHFATSEKELASLLPITAGQTEAAAWTTVTVTTIIIIADSAY